MTEKDISLALRHLFAGGPPSTAVFAAGDDGTDAIGGVINFITKRSYKGMAATVGRTFYLRATYKF